MGRPKSESGRKSTTEACSGKQENRKTKSRGRQSKTASAAPDKLESNVRASKCAEVRASPGSPPGTPKRTKIVRKSHVWRADVVNVAPDVLVENHLTTQESGSGGDVDANTSPQNVENLAASQDATTPELFTSPVRRRQTGKSAKCPFGNRVDAGASLKKTSCSASGEECSAFGDEDLESCSGAVAKDQPKLITPTPDIQEVGNLKAARYRLRLPLLWGAAKLKKRLNLPQKVLHKKKTRCSAAMKMSNLSKKKKKKSMSGEIVPFEVAPFDDDAMSKLRAWKMFRCTTDPSSPTAILVSLAYELAIEGSKVNERFPPAKAAMRRAAAALIEFAANDCQEEARWHELPMKLRAASVEDQELAAEFVMANVQGEAAHDLRELESAMNDGVPLTKRLFASKIERERQTLVSELGAEIESLRILVEKSSQVVLHARSSVRSLINMGTVVDVTRSKSNEVMDELVHLLDSLVSDVASDDEELTTQCSKTARIILDLGRHPDPCRHGRDLAGFAGASLAALIGALAREAAEPVGKALHEELKAVMDAYNSALTLATDESAALAEATRRFENSTDTEMSRLRELVLRVYDSEVRAEAVNGICEETRATAQARVEKLAPRLADAKAAFEQHHNNQPWRQVEQLSALRMQENHFSCPLEKELVQGELPLSSPIAVDFLLTQVAFHLVGPRAFVFTTSFWTDLTAGAALGGEDRGWLEARKWTARARGIAARGIFEFDTVIIPICDAASGWALAIVTNLEGPVRPAGAADLIVVQPRSKVSNLSAMVLHHLQGYLVKEWDDAGNTGESYCADRITLKTVDIPEHNGAIPVLEAAVQALIGKIGEDFVPTAESTVRWGKIAGGAREFLQGGRVDAWRDLLFQLFVKNGSARPVVDIGVDQVAMKGCGEVSPVQFQS